LYVVPRDEPNAVQGLAVVLEHLLLASWRFPDRAPTVVGKLHIGHVAVIR
jgi:hypothetical protein